MPFFYIMDRTLKVDLVMPAHQGERMTGTCFRGKNCRQAGNFFAWDCFRDMVQDEEFKTLMIAEMEKVVDEGSVNKRYRLELEFYRDICWDSVDDKE